MGQSVMTNRPPRQENLDRFEAKYARARSNVARQIGKEACGHDYSLSGYTTVAEARELVRHLGLHQDSSVLDLGSGRGWPAIHFEKEARCRVVATDVPLQGLQEAGEHLRFRAGADARALPFRSSSFDAVTHSDVFC